MKECYSNHNVVACKGGMFGCGDGLGAQDVVEEEKEKKTKLQNGGPKFCWLLRKPKLQVWLWSKNSHRGRNDAACRKSPAANKSTTTGGI